MENNECQGITIVRADDGHVEITCLDTDHGTTLRLNPERVRWLRDTLNQPGNLG